MKLKVQYVLILRRLYNKNGARPKVTRLLHFKLTNYLVYMAKMTEYIFKSNNMYKPIRDVLGKICLITPKCLIT